MKKSSPLDYLYPHCPKLLNKKGKIALSGFSKCVDPLNTGMGEKPSKGACGSICNNLNCKETFLNFVEIHLPVFFYIKGQCPLSLKHS